MKTIVLLALSLFLGNSLMTFAQEEEFNMDEFGEDDPRKVKTYCTNKVIGLSPSRLISPRFTLQQNV